MSVEKIDVHPTRLELLALRRRKALAEGIADIIQKDLEALIVALIEHRQKTQALRTKLFEELNSAYSLFTEAEMIRGSLKVRETAFSAPPANFDVEASTTTGILGIQFPYMKFKQTEDRTVKPRFNPIDAPIQMEEAVSETEQALISMLKLAELTAIIRKLLEAIALKRRQINRIRFKIVPQLDATIRYVELILEEIERQDAIRVRVLQRKRKEREVKTQ
jgi:V/A-type H+/Na+-transporting ATPase subunit D